MCNRTFIALFCYSSRFSAESNVHDESVQPLTDVDLDRIQINLPSLLEIVDISPECQLLAEMLSAQCITSYQYKSITTVEKLLEIITRKSVAEFKTFIKCLIKTKQKHVADLLTSNSGQYRYSATSSIITVEAMLVV